MCQEIGHVLGLAHQDEDFGNADLDTSMDYTSSPASNQHPDQHDYDQLEAIYTHLNGFNSWAPPPPTDDGSRGGKGNGKKGEPPGKAISEWGKAIRTASKGRPDLLELDLGNGNKAFTHVFWAN